MKRLRLFFYACTLLAAPAFAAPVDCSKAELAPNEPLAAYLRNYAKACIANEVHLRLEQYRIVVPQGASAAPPGEENLVHMVPAWRDIAAAFGRLADEAAPGAQTKTMYAKLRERAEATETALESALAIKQVPDIAPFGADTWKIPPNDLSLKQSGELPAINVDHDLDADCQTVASELCRNALRQGRELMLQWKLANDISFAASRASVDAIAKRIVAQEALWNRYLYDSKPMLPFDFVLTDWLTGGWSHSDQYPEGFRDPPGTQWFLFHPAAGFEYASAAAAGQRLQPVLYIELIGANRWRDDKRWFDVTGLRRLSGFSLVASYADRAGFKDVGYGGLFTFDNVYSIGIVRYGRQTGVFVSVDLANLWRDKYKPQYEKYKNQFEELKKTKLSR